MQECDVVISGCGIHVPAEKISNQELVFAFNQYVDLFNEENRGAIETGHLACLTYADAKQIFDTTGIDSRYVVTRQGLLDPDVMMPLLPERTNKQLSVQTELAIGAAKSALIAANLQAAQIDLIIFASSHLERATPFMASELQHALATTGTAFDLNAGSNSLVAAISVATSMLKSGSLQRALVVSAEVGSGFTNFRDKKSHFMSGDAASAMVLEHDQLATSATRWKIEAQCSTTRFNNAVRNNFSFLNRTRPDTQFGWDKLEHMVNVEVEQREPIWLDSIKQHLASMKLSTAEVARFWLQQSNAVTNKCLMQALLGKDYNDSRCPSTVAQYGDTLSVGVGIVFSLFNDDLGAGELGILCAYGLDNAVNSIAIRKC